MTPRTPRRAVGPPGGRPPAPEPRVDERDTEPITAEDEHVERLRAERPPHHDRER